MRGDDTFLLVRCQLINVKGMMELENHHLATIIVIINSAKKRQWRRELRSENLMRNGIFTKCQRTFPQKSFNYYSELNGSPKMILSAS